MALTYILSDANTGKRVILNGTFYVPDHGTTFALGVVPMPRADGSRAQDTPFMEGKAITLTGFLSAGTKGGALPFGKTPTTAEDFFDELRFLWEATCRNTLMILDYRNGWIQYVRPLNIRDVQAEGWPDLRAVQLQLYAEDPIAYSLENKLGVPASPAAHQLRMDVLGLYPTNFWRLRIESETARGVRVRHNIANHEFTLEMPAGDPLLIDGLSRQVFRANDLARVRRWDYWRAGGQFVSLFPNTGNLFSFFDAETGAALSVQAFPRTTEDLAVELSWHDADPMADSMPVAANLPAGAYDVAQYDVDVYG